MRLGRSPIIAVLITVVINVVLMAENGYANLRYYNNNANYYNGYHYNKVNVLCKFRP